jgi:hypothetical protein
LTFTLLLASLAACGDSGGASTTTGDESSTGDASTVAVTDTSTGDLTSGTTEAPTTGTGSATGSDTSATTGPADTSTGEDPSSTGAVVTGTSGTTAVDETTGDTGDTTTGATSDLVIAIVDAYLHADCMPAIPPDPAYGEFYVEFDNGAGASETSATLISASLSFAGADPIVIEPIMVTPDVSGPIGAGEFLSQKVMKLKGPAHSACMHCDEFYVLELEYQEGDYIHHVTEDVTIPCVF